MVTVRIRAICRRFWHNGLRRNLVADTCPSRYERLSKANGQSRRVQNDSLLIRRLNYDLYSVVTLLVLTKISFLQLGTKHISGAVFIASV